VTLRFRILLVISLVVAVAAAWFKAYWDRGHQELVPLLVVAQDVPAYTVLGPEHLGHRQVPRGAIEPGAIQDPSAVIGRTTALPLFRGEPLRPEKLLERDVGLLPGERALGLETDLVRSAGGTIRRGDHVDVYLQLPSAALPPSAPVASDLVVLEVKSASAQTLTGSDAPGAVPAAVVVKATPVQTQALAEASSKGKVILVRRPAAPATGGQQ